MFLFLLFHMSKNVEFDTSVENVKTISSSRSICHRRQNETPWDYGTDVSIEKSVRMINFHLMQIIVDVLRKASVNCRLCLCR